MENQETTTAVTAAESRTIILRKRCERLLDLYNPKQIHHTFAAVKTTTDCIALQSNGEPVLKAIARQGDVANKKLIATIKLNLIALDRFLHLKNPLSEEETEFIAEQIVDEFGGALTFADLHLVLKKGKAGQYGKFYERLSAPDVLDWFRQYFDSRLDAAEKYSYTKSKEAEVTSANLKAAMREDKELMQKLKSITERGRTKTKEQVEAEYQAYKKAYLQSDEHKIAQEEAERIFQEKLSTPKNQ